jgi:hypothetical protein
VFSFKHRDRATPTQPHHDLALVRAAGEVLVGGPDLVEAELTVDQRPDLVELEQADERLEHANRSDVHPLQTQELV